MGTVRPDCYWDEARQLYVKKIKDPDGRWVPIYGKTKAALRKNVDDRKKEYDREQELRENPEVWTYARQWYELHTGGYSAKRRQDYRNAINNHICPVIGSLQIRSVTYSNIREIMANSAELSKSSQQKIVTTLRRIFDAAVRDRLIAESPCADLKPGGQDAAEKVALTRAQQAVLLDTVRPLSIYPFVMICLYAGLRREEALGLRWADVDLSDKAPHIDVRTACNWEGKNQAKASELLKSDAAYRTIPIPPQLVTLLQQLRPDPAEGYVIRREDGSLWTAAAFRRAWDKIGLREAGVIRYRTHGKDVEKELRVGDAVPYHPGVTVTMDFHTTPHLLRHTYISELILAGASVKVAQYLAGHSSPVETLKIYTHLVENSPQNLIGDVLRTFAPDQIPAQISAQNQQENPQAVENTST